eukprot:1368263-Amorphochlora_amoeboformis.AAC.2
MAQDRPSSSFASALPRNTPRLPPPNRLFAFILIVYVAVLFPSRHTSESTLSSSNVSTSDLKSQLTLHLHGLPWARGIERLSNMPLFTLEDGQNQERAGVDVEVGEGSVRITGVRDGKESAESLRKLYKEYYE